MGNCPPRRQNELKLCYGFGGTVKACSVRTAPTKQNGYCNKLFYLRSQISEIEPKVYQSLPNCEDISLDCVETVSNFKNMFTFVIERINQAR